MGKVIKKDTPAQGSAIQFQPYVPPAPDSSPTPICGMGWRDIHARMEMLASRLESQAFVYEKHNLKLDFTKAKACKDLAYDCRRIAERVTKWPKLSPDALSGEKNWVTHRYLQLIEEGGKIMNERVL